MEKNENVGGGIRGKIKLWRGSEETNMHGDPAKNIRGGRKNISE